MSGRGNRKLKSIMPGYLVLLLVLTSFSCYTVPAGTSPGQNKPTNNETENRPYIIAHIRVSFSKYAYNHSDLIDMQGGELVPDEITGIASVDKISRDLGVRKIEISRKFRRTIRVHISSEMDVKEAERLYRNDPDVVYAKADYLAFFND